MEDLTTAPELDQWALNLRWVNLIPGLILRSFPR